MDPCMPCPSSGLQIVSQIGQWSKHKNLFDILVFQYVLERCWFGQPSRPPVSAGKVMQLYCIITSSCFFVFCVSFKACVCVANILFAKLRAILCMLSVQIITNHFKKKWREDFAHDQYMRIRYVP